jgi:hypothetical protein
LAAEAVYKLEGESKSQDNGIQEKGPYLELAVQKSPDNPPAAWLWRDPPGSLIGEKLGIRVGGGFVWPPPGLNSRTLRRVVFVAGGVGVNPLVSMLSSLASTTPASGGGDGFEVHFLYSLKDPVATSREKTRDSRHMLFLDRIAGIFREKKVKGRLHIFLTSGGDATTTTTATAVESNEVKGAETEDVDVDPAEHEASITCEGGDLPFYARRCTVDDVAGAVGTPAQRRFAVVYVCGVPAMTDEFVAKLTGLGMEPHRVLCEKWW